MKRKSERAQTDEAIAVVVGLTNLQQTNEIFEYFARFIMDNLYYLLAILIAVGIATLTRKLLQHYSTKNVEPKTIEALTEAESESAKKESPQFK